MQRYSRLMYRTARPMMAPRSMTQFAPLCRPQIRCFARQGYLEDAEAMRPTIAPFDDQAVSKKFVAVGAFLMPAFLAPFACLVAYMFRSGGEYHSH